MNRWDFIVIISGYLDIEVLDSTWAEVGMDI
jgi:hypothetical protein